MPATKKNEETRMQLRKLRVLHAAHTHSRNAHTKSINVSRSLPCAMFWVARNRIAAFTRIEYSVGRIYRKSIKTHPAPRHDDDR